MKTSTQSYPRIVGYKNAAGAAAGAAPAGQTATPPAAGAAPGAAGGAPGASNEMTAEQVQKMVADSVTKALGELLPAHLKTQLTAEQVSQLVATELGKFKGETKSLTSEQIASAASVATKAAIDNMSAGNKSLFNADDARKAGHISIEIPVGWSKGNLPLHAKQLLNILLKKNANEGVAADLITKGVMLGDAVIARMKATGAMGKALTSTGAGTGDEFVPTDLASELQRRMYLSSDLVALLAVEEFEMPTQPYVFPLSTTRPTFRLNSSENAATTASQPGTGGITLDAKKLMGQVDFSYEMEEDSIIPILPWLQGELGLAAAEALESAILNGDTAATHQDSDTHAIGVTAAEKSYNGLRKLALAVAALKKDLSSGGLSDANLRSMKKALGKWGTNPANLILVVGPNGQNDVEGMAEVSTVDKFGSAATIISGRLPRWRNIPIVTSAACRENLNASGVYDGTTTTKGSSLLFNRREFMLGRRRDFTIELDKDITTQTHKVVASFRRAFTARETPATANQTVSVGYNYTA